MSRLERHQKKMTRNRMFITIALIVGFIWFFLTYGIGFIINGSVFVASFLGGGRKGLDFGATPEFYTVEVSEIPVATNSASFQLAGNAENIDEITIRLNDQRVKKIDIKGANSFSTTVNGLKKGTNELYLVGRNNKTNDSKESERFTIILKTDNPAVEITEPQDGLKTPRDEIKVSGKTDTTGDLTVRINGSVAITDPNGNFQTTFRLQEGENKIKVTVTDSAGNTGEKEFTVSYVK